MDTALRTLVLSEPRGLTERFTSQKRKFEFDNHESTGPVRACSQTSIHIREEVGL